MTTESLTDSQRKTLACFDEGEPLTTSEVAERLDLGRRSTYERLDRLVDRSTLQTKKVGASARVWWRPEADAPTATESGDVPDWPAAAESLVDDVLDQADVGVFVLDENFDVAWVNDATERYFGLDREEILGEDKRQLVDERIASFVEDSATFTDTVLATYDDNTHTERFECHVTGGDGREERWLEHRSSPIESGAYAGGRVELYYDVTDHQNAQRAQERDNQEFERLVDAVEEYAIFTLDPEGCVKTWNPGAVAIKGYDADQIVGEHFSAFYTAEDREAGVPAENLATAAAEGAVEDEGWRVRADGTQFWANVTITAIRDGDGNVEGFAKVTRDMTERRAYEQRLEEQAERLQRQRDDLEFELEAIFDRISDGFYGLDDELRFTYVNDRAESLLGLDGDVVAGQKVWDALEVTEEFEDAVHEAFDSQQPVSVEDFYDPLDAWLENTVYPSESGLSIYFRDVTERRERERRLEESEQRYQTVLDTFPNGLLALFDETLEYELVGGNIFDEYDVAREDLEGSSVGAVVADEEVRAQLETHYRRAFDGARTAFEFEWGDRVFQMQVVPVTNDDGEVFAGMAMSQEVTDRKERERELERYETIVETVDDGVYAVDGDARFVTVNDAFCKLTGYDREELLGAPASTVHDEAISSQAESLIEAVAAGERSVAKIELDVDTKHGESVPCETRIAPFPTAGGHGRCGVVRDVSERLERERELRDRVRQQEVVTELGQRALENRDLDALMTEVTDLVAETLDTEYCKVLDLDQVAGELTLRQGVGWDDGVVGSASVSAVDDDSQAAFTLAAREPVVVEDLPTEPRFSGPDLLTDHDVRSGISVVVGPDDNPWGILGTHDTERRAFSDQDVNFVQSVANILATAISRHEHEAELVRQREQLAAINSLNEVVQDITDAVIDQSTREQIEQTVCERLADTDSYLFAWIGDVDVHSQTVDLRTEAGVDGYLDDVTISVDPDDERSRGATGRAFRTGEVQTTNDIQADERNDPWRENIEAYGFHSSAAIPIVHEGNVYGVLNVYAERPNAFEGQEREVVAQLGEVVGHAIAATERKRALMSDEVVELEFYIPDVYESLGVGWEPGGRVTLDRAVPLEDDEYLVYGTTTADGVEGVEAIVDAAPHWKSVAFHDSDGDGVTSFEVRLIGPPVLSVLASMGGSVEQAVVEDGDYNMTLHAPPSSEIRQIIDAVRDAYPTAELLKRRQLSRPRDVEMSKSHEILEELTDRQQAAVEAAYFAGFFEWPRASTGEDLAQSLGVSPPTFHQHLRKAEQKVFEALLS